MIPKEPNTEMLYGIVFIQRYKCIFTCVYKVKYAFSGVTVRVQVMSTVINWIVEQQEFNVNLDICHELSAYRIMENSHTFKHETIFYRKFTTCSLFVTFWRTSFISPPIKLESVTRWTAPQPIDMNYQFPLILGFQLDQNHFVGRYINIRLLSATRSFRKISTNCNSRWFRVHAKRIAAIINIYHVINNYIIKRRTQGGIVSFFTSEIYSHFQEANRVLLNRREVID